MVAHLLRTHVRAAQFVPDLIKAWTNMLLPNMETLRYEGLPRFPHTPDSVLNVAITSNGLPELRRPLSATG